MEFVCWNKSQHEIRNNLRTNGCCNYGTNNKTKDLLTVRAVLRAWIEFNSSCLYLITYLGAMTSTSLDLMFTKKMHSLCKAKIHSCKNQNVRQTWWHILLFMMVTLFAWCLSIVAHTILKFIHKIPKLTWNVCECIYNVICFLTMTVILLSVNRTCLYISVKKINFSIIPTFGLTPILAFTLHISNDFPNHPIATHITQ